MTLRPNSFLFLFHQYSGLFFEKYGMVLFQCVPNDDKPFIFFFDWMVAHLVIGERSQERRR